MGTCLPAEVLLLCVGRSRRRIFPLPNNREISLSILLDCVSFLSLRLSVQAGLPQQQEVSTVFFPQSLPATHPVLGRMSTELLPQQKVA